MLFEPFTLGPTRLGNRLVMAPMTRSRAVEQNTANALMAEYYGQRASAGLIISEGTSPSPNGLGYPRIPALYCDDHVRGWRLVTDAVHQRGGRIFVQLMHTGRVAHQLNLPAGARVLGPTVETCPGEMWTDQSGLQAHTPPAAMSVADIAAATGEFARAATLAIEAGFDGVELHAANGYLLEQFLNANVNTREDAYGGSAQARNRLVLEVASATATAIGAQRVGIRVSPFGVFNATGPYHGIEDQYLALARELSSIGLVYLHLVDHSAMGAPPVPDEFKANLRAAFAGCFIASGGFDRPGAEEVLREQRADLVAFGRAFLANPDLVARLRANAALNEPDAGSFYTPGAKGYTDYPTMSC
ncbi:alkene reductase [Accumulibacter sp.]|uniref:alkene reductase n=1 Tax=Accumulibacter sp. TaxID=2053492 RepID=UPI0025DDF406|nr:alkene reductase [Accumulibacter sp.]MCM8594014.1 alkene reductase [Accumulibacter sp.]MCM8627573.1 alkene reductase [Accumulibacter sp.]MDS4048156.1 alkene reductase [Accumulibacter sp.]